MRVARPAFVFASLFLVASFATAQCPPMGLALAADGDRMGDPFSIGIFGSPGVSGLMGIDVSPGPVVTPIGTVCLGLTPATLFSPFTLSPTGAAVFGGLLPALPYLTGFEAFLQAGATDPSQPGGFALSNGDSVKLRPPRLFVIDPGMPPTPFGGGTPGAFCVYDALADLVITAAIPLSSQVVDAVAVPQLGQVAFLLANSTIALYDAATVTPVLTIPLPGSPGSPSKLALDGTMLIVMYGGIPPSPFGGGTPGAVRTYDLPSGTPGPFVSLASGNPSAILAVPGSGFAYLRVGATVVPMDLFSAMLFPAIDMAPGLSGFISEWRLVGTTVYCLMPGSSPGPFGGGAPPALNGVATLTQTALFPAAVAVGGNGPGSALRYGLAGAGNALLFFHAGIPGIVHVSPSTLAVNGTIPVGAGFMTMERSDGGTEYLILCNGTGCGGSPILQAMNATTFAISNVTLVGAVQPSVIPMPSASFDKAYFLTGPNTIVPIGTDPASPPTGFSTLPVSSAAMKIAID
jgi:hypothetical protein